MIVEVSVGYATAVVGYDLLRDVPEAESVRPRILRGFALCGSAAGGDTKVEIKVGRETIGVKYNTSTGFPTRDHMSRIGARIPGGVPVHVIVTDAPATNPINALLDFVE